VRFRLEFRQSVQEYMRNLPLTRTGRVRLNTAMIQLAAEVPDSFRLDPANRPGPTSAFYHFRYIFEDQGLLRTLFVVVDDSVAAYGVLRVVHADMQPSEGSTP
jgi:hypothetical protein